jgi:hypothetical protein
LCVVWSLDTYRPAPYYWHNPYWYTNSTFTGSTVTAYNGDLATAHITDAGGYTTTDLNTATWTVS